MKPDPNWEKWAAWLGKEPKPGTIYKDVVDMMVARQIWESFQEIVAVAPEQARKFGTFHSWFNASYLRSQGLAVRRQVEVRDDVVSLGRLLDRIAKSPHVLSRKRYLAELHPENQRLGNEFFDSLAGRGAKAMDPSLARAQLKRLQDHTAKIWTWVDKEIAHYDPKTGEFGKELTFGQIHGAIDLIFETFNGYCQLILGTTIASGVVMPPWEVVFTAPWIPNEDAFRHVRDAALAKERARMGGGASGEGTAARSPS